MIEQEDQRESERQERIAAWKEKNKKKT